MLGVSSSAIGSVFESVFGSLLERALRSTERTVKQAGSEPLSAIGRVFESMPGSILVYVLGGVLGSFLRAYLSA